MAYDLTAVLRLQDKFSRPMKLATQAAERMKRTTDQMSRSLNMTNKASASATGGITKMSAKAERAFATMSKGAAGTTSMIGGLRGQFVGLAAAIGGAYAAKQLFDRTIGSAANNELSVMQIDSMFGNQQKAKAYMESLRKMAVDSPLLNSNQMFDNSKSLLGMTRDLKTLGNTWKVVEKLMAWAPERGVDDAVFSLREMGTSQDAVSLIERFGLDRKALNQIKQLKFEDQIKALDKLLNKMRITDDYIKRIGASAVAQWNQIKEKMDVALTDIGTESLKELKPVLIDINKWFDGQGFKNFKNSTAVAVASGFRGIVSAARDVASYIQQTYIDNPAFQKLTVKGKLEFVIEDLWTRFMRWFESTGSTQVANMTSFVLNDIGKYLIDHADVIARAGGELGVKLAASMGSAALNSMPGIVDSIGKQLSGARDGLAGWVDRNLEGKAPKVDGSHYNGISYIPNNNYVANLHKGERVMTAAENREYSKGGGKSITVNVGDLHLHGSIDGNSADRYVEQLMGKMARKIKQAGSLMA